MGVVHYTGYEFTIRGFDEFLLYRTFLGADEACVGLMASFDTDADVDFPTVTRTLAETADGAGIGVVAE